MSNLEVAQYLLQHGLEGLDGVLFLNERNERVDLAGGGHCHLGSLGITWDLDTHRIHGAAIYGNIYHQYTPNVSIYTVHGSYGIWQVVLERDSMKIIELAECLGYRLGFWWYVVQDLFSNYSPLAGVRTQFRWIMTFSVPSGWWIPVVPLGEVWQVIPTRSSPGTVSAQPWVSVLQQPWVPVLRGHGVRWSQGEPAMGLEGIGGPGQAKQ